MTPHNNQGFWRYNREDEVLNWTVPKRWRWSSTVCPEGGSRSRDMRSPSLWQQRAIIIDDSPSRDHKILIKYYQVIKTQAFYYHLSAIFMWCTGTPQKGISSEDFVYPQHFLFASGQQMFIALWKKILGRTGQYHDRQGSLSEPVNLDYHKIRYKIFMEPKNKTDVIIIIIILQFPSSLFHVSFWNFILVGWLSTES